MKKIMLRSLFHFLLGCPASLVWGQSLVAHRGASFDAPENTLAAFRLAWEQGADGIEADFRLSSDGQIVCIHDEDTERTAGISRKISDSSLEELRNLEVGAWKGERWRGEKIPTLAEVLNLVPPDKKIFIELKVGPEIVEPLVKEIAASSLKPEQTILMSFRADTVEACEQRLPQWKSFWLVRYAKQDDGGWTPTPDEIVETLQRIGADGLGTQNKPELVNAHFIEQINVAGKRDFHVWTVDDPQVARFYKELGAWAITTNRPGWIRKQLQ